MEVHVALLGGSDSDDSGSDGGGSEGEEEEEETGRSPGKSPVSVVRRVGWLAGVWCGAV